MLADLTGPVTRTSHFAPTRPRPATPAPEADDRNIACSPQTEGMRAGRAYRCPSQLVFDFYRAVDRARARAGERRLARSGDGHRGAHLQVCRSAGDVAHCASSISRPALRLGAGDNSVGIHIKGFRMPAAIRFRVGLDSAVPGGGCRTTTGNQDKRTPNSQKTTNSRIHRTSQEDIRIFWGRTARRIPHFRRTDRVAGRKKSLAATPAIRNPPGSTSANRRKMAEWSPAFHPVVRRFYVSWPR